MLHLYSNETRIVPRYSETDQMGVIYHSNYFVWFEVGRTDYLKNSSISYKEMEKMGIILPVIEVNCKYRTSAKYADNLIIKTIINKLTATRIMFHYEIIREEDNVFIAEGFTEHVFVDKESGRPTNLKKKHEVIYQQLQNIHKEEVKAFR
ncbi:acyl-CoA thioester hydrolase [Natronincola peptidivorans]|uniref:Acyl-CoA thioester hydrolase n=1 Tax=Natronincola peptidivorans TaxID=426128 RepID=A0A1I0EMV9_9FIRM|nr:acyl-CoA thioester hydrolase [Natronincola peptidivorans]